MAMFRCSISQPSVHGTLIEYIFEPSDIIIGGYINNGDGAVVPYDNSRAYTDFIEVTAGETLYFATLNGEAYNGWYDNSQTWVSAFIPAQLMGGQGYGTLTVPNGVSYMRLSAGTSVMQHTSVWRQTTV